MPPARGACAGASAPRRRGANGSKEKAGGDGGGACRGECADTAATGRGCAAEAATGDERAGGAAAGGECAAEAAAGGEGAAAAT